MVTKILPALLPLCACSIVGHASAQDPCSLLTLEQLHYDAFDPSAVELVVNNQSASLFSYPSFVLVDAQDDTLAREQVSFLGIGTGPQAHYLSAGPGASFPSGAFDGTLLLFGEFNDTLYCTWDLEDITLCPPDSCIEASIYLTNTGPLAEFVAFWWVTNTADGNQVASGNFAMSDVDATQFDTLCLPPGNYVLEFTPFSPIDESYVVGITPNYQFTLGTNTALQQDSSPLDLSFSWYAGCVDGTNGISSHDHRELTINHLGDHLRITDPMGRALGEISLWSTDGRLVYQRTTSTASIDLPLHQLASGIHMVRVGTGEGPSFTEHIFTP
ncbi:MAG: T9SS type A sorting domain-containing protein [Flavobacteriales bacterium]